MIAPESRPAPSPADIVRASSTIEATRRGLGDNRHYPILEAAETLSAALQAERTKREAEGALCRTCDGEGLTMGYGRTHTCERCDGSGREPDIHEAIDPDPCPPYGIARPGWFARRFTVVHVAACTLVGGAMWASLGWIILAVVTS